jgi:D-aspartate oxidase
MCAVSGTAFSGPTEQITRKWIYDAYHHWDEIRQSVDASNAGVCQMSGYIFSSTSPSITRVIVLSYRKIEQLS